MVQHLKTPLIDIKSHFIKKNNLDPPRQQRQIRILLFRLLAEAQIEFPMLKLPLHLGSSLALLHKFPLYPTSSLNSDTKLDTKVVLAAAFVYRGLPCIKKEPSLSSRARCNIIFFFSF